MSRQTSFVDFVATVPAGGSVAVSITASVDTYALDFTNMAIIAPSAGAKYGIEIVDAASNPIYNTGPSACTGNQPLIIGYSCTNNFTLTITGTTGAYSGRIYWKL